MAQSKINIINNVSKVTEGEVKLQKTDGNDRIIFKKDLMKNMGTSKKALNTKKSSKMEIFQGDDIQMTVGIEDV
jgi:hypothetical protein